MCQLWIARGEQLGLSMHTAMTESGSLLRADEMLTAFMELELAIRACGDCTCTATGSQ